MTAMRDALERAGFSKEEMEIYPALIRFFKSGGSLQRLQVLCGRAATEILGEGQIQCASIGPNAAADAQSQTRNEGHVHVAQSSQAPHADVPHPLPGGQSRKVDNIGQPTFASGQSNTSQGLSDAADQANRAMPSAGAQSRTEATLRVPVKAITSLPPVREPSASDIAGARYAADLTFGEIVKLRGRMLDLYRFKDLKNVRHLNNYENAIINDCIDYGRQHRIKEDRKIGLSIPRAEIQKIVNRAKTAIQSKDLLTMPKYKRGKKAHG